MAIDSFFVSVPEMIALNARNRPTTVAWRTDSEAVDWRTFNASVNRSANALIALGVEKGDAVAVLAENSLWSWMHSFGALRAGGVLAPLNTMLRPDTLARLLIDSGAKTLLVSSSYASLATDVAGELGANERRLVVLSEGGALSEGKDFSALASKAPDTDPAVPVAPEDPCNLIYSSGTTGLPKGIVHTHGARAHTSAMFATTLRVAADARLLLSTPLHTNGSWAMVLPTVYMGATTIITPKFEPESFFRLVRAHRPSLALLVPTMAHVLTEHPEAGEIDWSCFDFLLTGGAPMPLELKQRVRELTGNRLGEFWGFTEGVGSLIQPHEVGAHLDSVGRALPECDLRLIDDNDREVGPGEAGELVGRSTFMMKGYHNRPDATREIIWRSPEGTEYLRTGDIGVRDVDGWITIRGRKKDMIVSGGLNVYPVDIEEVLYQHEDISECTVGGVPHPKWGETPVAFVVLKSSARTTSESLASWANERLAKHQRLHALVLRNELPRNTLGKVLKAQLVDDFLQDFERSRESH